MSNTKEKYQGKTQEDFFEDKKNKHLFVPGQSGNPDGRPKNILNKKAVSEIASEMGVNPILLICKVLSGDTQDITDKTGVSFKNMSISEYLKNVRWMGDKMYANPKETTHILDGISADKKPIIQIEYPAKGSV